MLSKQTQRFIKEGLLAIYRHHPKAINYAVYYLPFEHKNFTEIGLSIRSMHGIPEIPWPEEDCIICTEDYISSLLGHDLKLFIMILRTKDQTERMRMVPKADDAGCVESLEVFNVALTSHRGKPEMHVIPHMVTMVHRDGIFKSPDNEDAHFEKKAREFPMALTDEQRAKLVRYWKAVSAPTFDGMWVAKEMGLPNQDKMGLASDILGYLANIVVPCHYFVKSHFEDGFGTKAQRRITRFKPIFSVISYDRLHQTFLPDDEEYTDQMREPHFRRGHIRHHWKKAGLNRLALPEDPLQRMRLVHKHRVERSYIPPTWVGENIYSLDGVTHEIVTTEIPLAQVGRT